MIALVTGSSSGFGEAIARRLLREGARVIAAGRRTERLKALREELGEGLWPLTLDVTDRAAVAWVVSRPAHVNINSLSVMPVAQAFGPLAVKRSS